MHAAVNVEVIKMFRISMTMMSFIIITARYLVQAMCFCSVFFFLNLILSFLHFAAPFASTMNAIKTEVKSRVRCVLAACNGTPLLDDFYSQAVHWT